MIPTTLIEAVGPAKLAADTATLDAIADVKIFLIKAAFTPGFGLAMADLVEADFDGYAALAKDASAPSVSIDPATGDRLVRIPDPAGGWNWSTSGATNLPQDIHGFGCCNDAKTVLYGTELFDDPVELDGIGEGVSVGDATFRFPSGVIT